MKMPLVTFTHATNWWHGMWYVCCSNKEAQGTCKESEPLVAWRVFMYTALSNIV
jgi:hypothetical protein